MISFHGEDSFTLSSVTRSYDVIQTPRILTTGLTQQEVATREGHEFQAFFVDDFSAGETRYIAWENPIASTVDVGLVERLFVAQDGAVGADILWDYTIDTTVDTLTSFNQSNAFRGILDAQYIVTEVTLSDEGIIREPIVVATGSGGNAVGGVAPSVGFRMYEPGTGFVFKVTNNHNSTNRILVSYTWVEFDNT